MPIRKQTQCSVCGQTIPTMTDALFMTKAPVVCRSCFGHQTYKTPGERSSKVVAPPEQTGGSS